MSTPNYLNTGDKVAILCPASYISTDLTSAYEILKKWGLEPIIYKSVSARDNHFAGTDELRTKDFQEALDNPEIKAIIAARGGYGSVRIIDQINFEKFQQNPKWIVGFSDVTVIHSHIQNNYKIPTIHGQMIKSLLTGTEASKQTLYNALFGKNIDLEYKNNAFPNRIGNSEGVLIGGNLALLQSIIASSSDTNYDNKILFIEDVEESFYNIDRMLWTLKRAGKLSKLKGLIVGSFTELKDSNPSFGQKFEEIIIDKVKEYNYPVAFSCPSGHIEDNHALVLGRKINLQVDTNNVKLTYID